ncbi:hypothetical protein ABIE38_001561 [Dietzia sp. 2505]|uniref:hypothetical protein n=1 Tax=Dietzia TaxID=37914 RepID=UPI0015F9FEC2|nr:MULTISPECIES: hypothetical protein [Dietzia]MBB1033459.1 hypothetical protein [Dietzia sp. CQ4]MBB1036693.1 hypothetical protein [Dietzia natronolimnaea]MBB1040682.1 hypothetical protein [Dietzia sp. Cai40]MBB1043433.1 hypothetical protein [Dietzia sp. DQ11-44]MBB1053048.1 hypothetical protein [Dietzia sp. B44]
MGSIDQGLGLLQLGSTTFTTGSGVIDAGTDFLGAVVGVIRTAVNGAAGLIGSAELV